MSTQAAAPIYTLVLDAEQRRALDAQLRADAHAEVERLSTPDQIDQADPAVLQAAYGRAADLARSIAEIDGGLLSGTATELRGYLNDAVKDALLGADMHGATADQHERGHRLADDLERLEAVLNESVAA